jgi:hypothetical protein
MHIERLARLDFLLGTLVRRLLSDVMEGPHLMSLGAFTFARGKTRRISSVSLPLPEKISAKRKGYSDNL